jgi:hypothetical protein
MKGVTCTAAVLLALVAAGPLRAGSDQTLEDAEQIRSEVQPSGGPFVITEASSTAVVESLALLAEPLAAPRFVAAAGGVYYAICAKGTRCPYPAGRAAHVRARVPRQMALELVRRTLERTAADVVVVSLPTREPALLVLERGDLVHASPDELDRLTLTHIYAIRSLVAVSDVADALVLARIPLA